MLLLKIYEWVGLNRYILKYQKVSIFIMEYNSLKDVTEIIQFSYLGYPIQKHYVVNLYITFPLLPQSIARAFVSDLTRKFSFSQVLGCR